MRVTPILSATAAIGPWLTAISSAIFNRQTSRALNFHKPSRTSIAVAQMVGDSLILTTLSYVSLKFVIFPYIDIMDTEYSIYIFLTIRTLALFV